MERRKDGKEMAHIVQVSNHKILIDLAEIFPKYNDNVKSILRISSAHNEGGPTDKHCPNEFLHELKLWFTYSFTSIEDQNSARCSVNIK